MPDKKVKEVAKKLVKKAKPIVSDVSQHLEQFNEDAEDAIDPWLTRLRKSGWSMLIVVGMGLALLSIGYWACGVVHINITPVEQVKTVDLEIKPTVYE